jgi:hypothetical protein
VDPPAIGPADSQQRSASVGRNSGGRRASSRASLAEKENDANHYHQRDAARTPNKPARYSTGGGAKSFMAPTISAASKAASPRKKVLGDRNNDPAHPAVPSSSTGDLLAHAKPRAQPPPSTEEAAGTPRRLRLSLDGAPAPPPLAAAPAVASHGARCSLGGGAGLEEVEDPVCKVHHCHDKPADAAPPYDPKTNYLSPRPQFLRYRPNPRVELYRQTTVRRLEDGFSSSQSSDETDIATTTEDLEGLSEEEHESDAAADTVTADVLAPPEPEQVSPLPQAPTPEPEEPAATSLTSELEPAVTPASAPAKKKRSSLRFLLVAPLALALLMVASLVCVTPAPASPAVLNASLSKASGYFLAVQELHPVELPAWLKQWSSSSLDFVSSYWNTLASFRQQEFFGLHIAANLSAAAGDGADRVGFYYSAAETRPMPTELEPISASVLGQKMEFQVVDSASDPVATEEDEPTDAEMVQESVSLSASALEQEMEFQVVDSASDYVAIEEDEATGAEMVQESVSILEQEMEKVVDSASDSVAIEEDEMVQESVSATSNGIEELNYGDDLVLEEVPHSEMDEEVSGSSREDMASSIQDLGIPSQSEPEPEHTVNDMDVHSLQQDVQTDETEGDQKEAHVKKDQEAHHGQKLGSDTWSRYLDNFSNPTVAGSALAVLVVSAALAFLYMRQNQARVSSDLNEPTADQPAEQVEQVKNGSGSGSSEGHALAKSSHLQNPLVEETGRIGDSGASQYSSSLSSGLSKRRKDKEEQSLQSLEPMSRRESTGTSSYGSFTTYEKIPAKKVS